MNCRAIAFDLDDTLLRDDLSVSDYTADTLREAARRGFLVIPCSGRARDSMLPIVRRIGCASCFVACNGSEVWSAEGELLHRSLLTHDTTQAIAAFGRRHGVYMQTYQGAHFYFTEEGRWADAYARSSMLTGCFTPDLESFLAAHDICKILMMGEVEHIAAMLAEGQPLFAGRASVTCSKPYFLEFNPPDSNKAHGLEIAGKLFGFTLGETMAFGDSLNDLSMLQAAGCGVCVANAREDVRAQVGRVCPSNGEDGVARYLRQTLLQDSAKEVCP